MPLNLKQVLARTPNEFGKDWEIWFEGDLAIKTKSPEFLTGDEFQRLQRESRIARALAEEGINVPKMYGVFPQEESQSPALVMQRLNLTDSYCLTSDEIRLAIRQYVEQTRIAESMGYELTDTRLFLNNGFDRNQQRLFFYDFDEWQEP